jgi:hypothetical protein
LRSSLFERVRKPSPLIPEQHVLGRHARVVEEQLAAMSWAWMPS